MLSSGRFALEQGRTALRSDFRGDHAVAASSPLKTILAILSVCAVYLVSLVLLATAITVCLLVAAQSMPPLPSARHHPGPANDNFDLTGLLEVSHDDP